MAWNYADISLPNADIVLLCGNNATIDAHVKTQNLVKHRSDTLTRDPTRPGQNRWPSDPVTRFHLCFTLCERGWMKCLFCNTVTVRVCRWPCVCLSLSLCLCVSVCMCVYSELCSTVSKRRAVRGSISLSMSSRIHRTTLWTTYVYTLLQRSTFHFGCGYMSGSRRTISLSARREILS